jgi:hypothetical protein
LPSRLRVWLPRMLLMAAAFLALVPAPAAALAPATRVSLTAQVRSDGTVLVTERRTVPDPRPIEFQEFLVPNGATLELTGLGDQAGAFSQVVYVQWSDPAPRKPQEIQITFTLTNSLILHGDAVEWYWPASTGSGLHRVTATPVVGVYLVAGRPAGYLTRLGGPVTDRSAHMAPTAVAAPARPL